MADAVVVVEDLCKSFGNVVALDKVSFSIERGAACGLVGPNGAGKTTLISILTGLIRGRGRVVISEEFSTSRPRQIGVLLEHGSLFDLLTPREHLSWICATEGVPERKASQRIAELGEVLNLAPWFDQVVAECSKGTRKKLGFAMAVIVDPRLILMDEPFDGVDLHGLEAMSAILRQFHGAGATSILSSHALHMLQDVCDSFALISAGKIIASGSLDELRSLARGDELRDAGHAAEADLREIYRTLVRPTDSSVSLTTLAQPSGDPTKPVKDDITS